VDSPPGAAAIEESPASGMGSHSPGLFYATACVLCDLSAKHKWIPFVTSSSTTIDAFTSTGATFSAVRGSIHRVHPTVMITVEDMRTMLQSYFNIPTEYFEHPEIQTRLQRCIGRPLLFIDAVFRPICAGLISGAGTGVGVSSMDVPTLSCLLEAAYENVVHIFKVRMAELLTGSRHLATNTAETTRAFVRCLIQGLYFNNGVVTLSSNDLLAKAVSTGLLPCSSGTPVGARVNIQQEPLVAAAVTSALDEELSEKGVISMLERAILPTHPEKPLVNKRALAQMVLAGDFALRTWLHKLEGGRMLLRDVIAPLYCGGSSEHLITLGDVICNATAAMDMRDWDVSKCALRAFVREDGSIDDSLILYNLPERMGGDLAFVATPYHASAGVGSTTGSGYQFVIASLNNTSSDSFSVVMRTLSPGTQYLTTEQRNALIAGGTLASMREPCPGGADYLDWQDYVASAAEFPFLTEKWIRLPIVARPVHPKIYAFAAGLPTYERTLADKLMGKWKGSVLRAAQNSPVVVLNLDSPAWLSETLRHSFAEPTSSEMAFSGSDADWAPRSARDAALSRKKSGGKFTMPAGW
jgi:hypothetical protein